MPRCIAALELSATPSADNAGEATVEEISAADNMIAASERPLNAKYICRFSMMRRFVASSWNRGQLPICFFAWGDCCHVETEVCAVRIYRYDIFVKDKSSKHCRVDGKLPTHDFGEKSYPT